MRSRLQFLGLSAGCRFSVLANHNRSFGRTTGALGGHESEPDSSSDTDSDTGDEAFADDGNDWELDGSPVAEEEEGSPRNFLRVYKPRYDERASEASLEEGERWSAARHANLSLSTMRGSAERMRGSAESMCDLTGRRRGSGGLPPTTPERGSHSNTAPPPPPPPLPPQPLTLYTTAGTSPSHGSCRARSRSTRRAGSP